MATRTVPFATYATDGSRNTTVTPTATVQYGSGSASAATVTQRGNAWSVDVDDTQDALVLWSGTGLASDHLIALKYPPQLDANVSTRLASADYTTPPTAIANASAVRTELTTELGRIDVATSTRLASSAYTAAPSAATNAAAVWDEVLTGATHNVASSAGRRLRNLAANVTYAGTVEGAGVNGNQVVLDAGASSVNGAYDPSLIVVNGQSRRVIEYDGSTRTATVNRAWRVNPTAGQDFTIYADAGSISTNEGLLRAATPTTARLNASARTEDGVYVGQVISLISGTGDDQARVVVAYDGATQTATVETAWQVTPDTTTGYEMLPTAVRLDYARATDLAALTADVAALHDFDPATDTVQTVATVTNPVTATVDTSGVASDVWAYTTRTVTAPVSLTSSYDAAKTAATQASVDALHDLSTADVTAAVESATADLATQADLTAAIATVPDAVDAQLTSTKGAGPWGASVIGWTEVTGATLDTDGNTLLLDRPDVLVAAYSGATLVAATRSNGSGDFSLFVPPAGTYTLVASAVGFTYHERTVAV